MSLTTMLKCIPAAQLSTAFAKHSAKATVKPPLWGLALLGLVLTLGGPNRFAKQTGAAVALLATGVATGTATAKGLCKDECLAGMAQLQASHERREAALKTSLDIAMAESEARADQLAQMNAVLADWQKENVLIAGQLDVLQKERRQLLYELHETALTEGALHPQLVQAEARITDVDAALRAKTNLAAQMLSELEAEATGTFNHFSAKIDAQGTLIHTLRQQIEGLKKANTDLIDQSRRRKRFEPVGLDSPRGDRLLDYLAK